MNTNESWKQLEHSSREPTSESLPNLRLRIGDELRQRTLQPLGDTGERIDRWVAHTSFDTRDVGSIKVDDFAQFFLRDSKLKSPGPD